MRDLTPEEVARGLTEGRMLLIDVRTGQTVWQEVLPEFTQLAFLGNGRAMIATLKFLGPVCPEYEILEVRDFGDDSHFSERLYSCPSH